VDNKAVICIQEMNQSQNSGLSYGLDVGISFKERILGWPQVKPFLLSYGGSI
jgi:hypothetical protein